ncbi:hypothetical protein BQ8794_130199 [Mesorhizobium prunaredense]|uniref:MoaF-like domain-containing protein n=1 Tax=Mesorhizobium prunaredense TaxID=1631249 RepID=A0A1R3V4P2_9HYPH|nr:hypothetical protein BQ8794_130199 [Mesorhizobium prunaredense]
MLLCHRRHPDCAGCSSRLRWTCLEGQDKGRSAEERYKAIEISPGFWFVHWMEADGIAVTQVIQPDAAVINTTIIIPAAPAGSEKPFGLVHSGTSQTTIAEWLPSGFVNSPRPVAANVLVFLSFATFSPSCVKDCVGSRRSLDLPSGIVRKGSNTAV